MRTKVEILREVGNAYKDSPRSGIIPDLADVLMIDVLIDIRDAFFDTKKVLCGIYDHLVMDK